MELEKTNQITISSAAAEQIKLQLEKRGTPNGILRIGLKGGGCSGYSYNLQFEDAQPEDKDIVFQSEGVTLVTDKKSLTFLKGSVLDWEQTILKKGFVFINPNSVSKCGCGKSFST